MLLYSCSHTFTRKSHLEEKNEQEVENKNIDCCVGKLKNSNESTEPTTHNNNLDAPTN